MTIPQSPLFQWCVCTVVLYVVFVSLYLEYRHRRDKAPQTQEPPQSEQTQPYNVIDEAEQVLYGYQQSEVSE